MIKIDVRLEDETVWLTQQQLADLYHTSKSNVSEHITNIFKEGELDEAATVRKFRTVQIEGGRNVERNLLHYFYLPFIIKRERSLRKKASI